ncbi:6722_t:CDS:2 [Rhizophagus irregularis]|nr:6722_t:CDS:2 [Rhizophagus irregularis]
MINPPPRRYHAIPGYEVQAPGRIKKKISYINLSLIPDLEGQEVGRVEWNYSAVPLSYSSKNNIDRQDIPAVPAECITVESKVKKTEGKKTKSKSVRISESAVIQTPLASKSLNISNEELVAFYEKEDKRDRKITEEVNRILAT